MATPFMPAQESALEFHPWIALSSGSSLPSLRPNPLNIQQKHIRGHAAIEPGGINDIYDSVTLLREAPRAGVLIVADHPTFFKRTGDGYEGTATRSLIASFGAWTRSPGAHLAARILGGQIDRPVYVPNRALRS
jgi:hypothetical protein